MTFPSKILVNYQGISDLIIGILFKASLFSELNCAGIELLQSDSLTSCGGCFNCLILGR